MSFEKSYYVYQYIQNKANLEGMYEYVPDINFMKYAQESNVYTLFSWDDAISTLIPKTDFVLISRKEELSLVPYDTIITIFENYLEKCEGDLYFIKRTPETIKLFNQIPQIDIDGYEIINADDFVDINLNEQTTN